ncbi:membrane protein containing LPXTG-motif cell wall anchor domain protein [Candidatus Magnetomorum sp. HK-1]|nr:membrane protein containing LPXTG-motif cell wall anchor domain protein [Candidatus Magnetomorum sp. HK-1]
MKKQALQVLLLILILCGYAIAQTDTEQEEDTTEYHPIVAQFVEETAVPGDTVTLKLSFQLPKGMTFPEKIPVQGLDEFNVMGIDTEDSDINIRLLVDTIDAFDVPALTVLLTHPNGTPMAYKSDPIMLSLNLPFDETDTELEARPIKDIIPVTGSQKYVLYAIIALICLLIGLGIWFYLKKRNQKIIEQQYQKAPEEIAFDALRDLNRDAHLFRDNYKAFYFRLTHILKEYMGHIRHFPAAELTTEEIAAKVKENLDIDMVRLMRKADTIKFADYRPTTAEREEHWKSIWSYTKTTSDERIKEESQ